MVSNCWICKISYKSSVKRSYHKFPRDKTMRRLWFAATGMTEEMFTERRRICSDHFQLSDYDIRDGKRNTLLATAVPCRDYDAFATSEYENELYDAEYHDGIDGESEAYHLEEESHDVMRRHLPSIHIAHSEESNSQFLNDNTNTSTVSQGSSANVYRDVEDQIMYANESNESDSYSQIERRLEDNEDVLHKKICVELSEKRKTLNRSHVTSDKAWNLYLKYRQSTQRQKNFLSHKCVQLDKNLYNLKRLLDNLRNKRLEVSI